MICKMRGVVIRGTRSKSRFSVWTSLAKFREPFSPVFTVFRFIAGVYKLRIYAHLLGDRHPKLLFEQDLEISSETAAQLAEPENGLYFDWGPDSRRYLTHIEEHPPSPDPAKFLEALALTGRRS